MGRKKFIDNEKFLIDNVQKFFSFLNRDADIFEIYNSTDLFYDKCVESLRALSEEIRFMWYELLKSKIRNKRLDRKIVIDVYEKIEKLLKREIFIKCELYDLLKNEDSIKRNITSSLKKYLPNLYNLNESVYIKHDGYTILKLINYWEEEYAIPEINPLIFSGKETYIEFCVELYSFLLGRGEMLVNSHVLGNNHLK